MLTTSNSSANRAPSNQTRNTSALSSSSVSRDVPRSSSNSRAASSGAETKQSPSYRQTIEEAIAAINATLPAPLSNDNQLFIKEFRKESHLAINICMGIGVKILTRLPSDQNETLKRMLRFVADEMLILYAFETSWHRSFSEQLSLFDEFKTMDETRIRELEAKQPMIQQVLIARERALLQAERERRALARKKALDKKSQYADQTDPIEVVENDKVFQTAVKASKTFDRLVRRYGTPEEAENLRVLMTPIMGHDISLPVTRDIDKKFKLELLELDRKLNALINRADIKSTRDGSARLATEIKETEELIAQKSTQYLLERTAAFQGVLPKQLFKERHLGLMNNYLQSLVFQTQLRWLHPDVLDEDGMYASFNLQNWSPFEGPFGTDGPVPFDPFYDQKMTILLTEPRSQITTPYLARKLDWYQAVAMSSIVIVSILQDTGLREIGRSAAERNRSISYSLWEGFYYANVYGGAKYAHTTGQQIRLYSFLKQIKRMFELEYILNDHRILMSYFVRADANPLIMIFLFESLSLSEKAKFLTHGPLLCIPYDRLDPSMVLYHQMNNWHHWFVHMWAESDQMLYQDHRKSSHYLFMAAIWGTAVLNKKGTRWSATVNAISQQREARRWKPTAATAELAGMSHLGHRIGAFDVSNKSAFEPESIATNPTLAMNIVTDMKSDAADAIDILMPPVDDSTSAESRDDLSHRPGSRLAKSRVKISTPAPNTVFTGLQDGELLNTLLFKDTNVETRPIALYTPWDIARERASGKFSNYPGSQVVTLHVITEMMATARDTALLLDNFGPIQRRLVSSTINSIFERPETLIQLVQSMERGPFSDLPKIAENDRVELLEHQATFAYKMSIIGGYATSKGYSLPELLTRIDYATATYRSVKEQMDAKAAEENADTGMSDIHMDTEEKNQRSASEMVFAAIASTSALTVQPLPRYDHQTEVLSFERNLIDQIETRGKRVTASEEDEARLSSMQARNRMAIRIRLAGALGMSVPTKVARDEFGNDYEEVLGEENYFWLRIHIAIRWRAVFVNKDGVKQAFELVPDREVAEKKLMANELIAAAEERWARLNGEWKDGSIALEGAYSNAFKNPADDGGEVNVNYTAKEAARAKLAAEVGIDRNNFGDDPAEEQRYRASIFDAWIRKTIGQNVIEYYTSSGERMKRIVRKYSDTKTSKYQCIVM